MKRIYRLGLIVLVLTVCTGCDQATKSIAKESLASSAPISLLNDSIRIEYSENPGAFLSLGSNLTSEARLLLFVIVVGAILVFTLLFMISRVHSLSLMQLFGLSLLVGGGMGNLLDRLLNDGVAVDFMRLGIGPLRTGIFNVADVAIVAGAFIVIVNSMKIKNVQAANGN